MVLFIFLQLVECLNALLAHYFLNNEIPLLFSFDGDAGNVILLRQEGKCPAQ